MIFFGSFNSINIYQSLRVLLLPLLLNPIVSYAQLPNISASWGSQDTIFHTSRAEVVGTDPKGGVFLLKYRTKKGIEAPYILEHFDKDLWLTSVSELKVNVDGKPGIAEQVFQLNKKIYFIYSSTDRKKSTITLFVQELNATLHPEGDALKLFETKAPRKGQFNKGGLKLYFSRDSSRVFATANYFWQGRATNLFLFALFDQNFKALWNNVVPLYQSSAVFRLQNIKIDKTGKVIMLGLYGDDYDLLTFNHKGDSMNRFSIRMKDAFLNSVQIELLGNNKLVCTGLYSKTSRIGSRGIYFIKLDLSKGRKVEVNSNSEFNLTFITQDVNTQDIRIARSNTDKNGAVELFCYALDHLMIQNDGGIIITGEQKYRIAYPAGGRGFMYKNAEFNTPIPTFINDVTGSTTLTGGSNVRAGAYQYFNNNIMVIKVDSSGQIVWTQKVHKSQNLMGDDSFYTSYLSTTIRGKICFFFNIDPRNINEDRVLEDPLDYKGNKSIVKIVSLDNEGNQTKQWIYNSVDLKVNFVPKDSKMISGDEMILFGRKGYHQQLGRVNFK